LCPHACRLADDQVGACRVRRRRGERMETATFATSVEHLDAVERKPFYHYRPGTLALTLAAPGCSFACDYCQNFRLSQFGRSAEAPWRTVAVDPAALARRAADRGAALALSYSEPILALEMTLALAAAGRPLGVEVLWKTNGFLTAQALDRIAPHLAAVNVDVKSVDEATHRALTGAAPGPVLEAIAGFVAAGVWVEVSTPVIPGVNGRPDALRRIAEAICRVSPDLPWHLLRLNPDFRLTAARPTSPAELAEAAAIGRAAGLRFVYVERALGPEGRATFCPACGREVVCRDIWSTRSMALRGGRCSACQTAIPGRWELP
jgi:pyruvate formate lyase activating enzyme